MNGVAFDLTINIAALMTLAALGAGGVAAWVTLRVHVTAHKAALDQAAEALAANAKRIEEVRARGAKELADYKLEVAQRYATIELIREIEERMLDAINRLGDRFDRYFDPPAAARRTRKPD